MMDLSLRKLLSNISATLGRHIIAGILQLGLIVIIARVCGPEGNGSYAVALLLPTMLASLLNLGIAPANVYFLGSNKVSPMAAWKATLVLYAALAIVGVGTGIVILAFYNDVFFPGIPDSLLWLALPVFPLSLLLNFITSFYQGLQKFKQFNLILLLQPAVTLVCTAAMVALGSGSIENVILAYLLATSLTVFVSFVLLRPLIEGGDGAKQAYSRELLSYGFRAHLSNIVTFLNYRADIFLVNFFVGPAGAGVYVVAVQLVEKLWMISAAVSTVLLPRLSELSTDEEKKRILTPLVCRWVLAITFFCAVSLAVLSKFLVAVIFGADFIDATGVLLILVPGVVLWAGGRILANDIASRGVPEFNFYVSVLVLVVNIVGNILLIPLYGIKGAAMATCISYIVDFVAKSAIYSKITNSRLCDIFIIRKADLQYFRCVREA